MTEDWETMPNAVLPDGMKVVILTEEIAILRRQNARQAETIEVLQIELQLMREARQERMNDTGRTTDTPG